jgi:hypothetical protein
MARGLLGAVPSSRAASVEIEVYVSLPDALPDALPEYLPRGKVVGQYARRKLRLAEGELG